MKTFFIFVICLNLWAIDINSVSNINSNLKSLSLQFYINGHIGRMDLKNKGTIIIDHNKILLTLYDIIFKSPFISIYFDNDKIIYFDKLKGRTFTFIIKNKHRPMRFLKSFSHYEMIHLLKFQHPIEKAYRKKIKNNYVYYTISLHKYTALIKTITKSINIENKWNKNDKWKIIFKRYINNKIFIPINIYIYNKQYNASIYIKIKSIKNMGHIKYLHKMGNTIIIN